MTTTTTVVIDDTYSYNVIILIFHAEDKTHILDLCVERMHT